MPYVIFSSFLNIVLVRNLSQLISFAPKTTLYTLTTEGLKCIQAFVNLTCLETKFKAKDSEVSNSRHSQNVICS